VQTISGPIVGAIVYAGLHEHLTRVVEQWRFVLGLSIVVLVLAFPQGIAGFAQHLWSRRRGEEAA
jgi:branched-chain amino acid transport system permease protein